MSAIGQTDNSLSKGGGRIVRVEREKDCKSRTLNVQFQPHLGLHCHNTKKGESGRSTAGNV